MLRNALGDRWSWERSKTNTGKIVTVHDESPLFPFLLFSSGVVFSVVFSFFFFAAKYFSMMIPHFGHVENSISIRM
jgi:hypothetical protein